MNDFAELRGRLVAGVFRVMQTRQFVRLFQDQRLLWFIMDGMSVRARMRLMLHGAGGGVARALGLATLDDLHDLERQIRASDSSATD